MVSIIERREVEALLGKTNVIVGEVLSRAHYDAGHLPGAVHLPLEGLEKASLAKDATIIVYCAGPTCSNSDQAAERLLRAGYADVRVFRGGKQEWREAGLSLEAAL